MATLLEELERVLDDFEVSSPALPTFDAAELALSSMKTLVNLSEDAQRSGFRWLSHVVSTYGAEAVQRLGVVDRDELTMPKFIVDLSGALRSASRESERQQLNSGWEEFSSCWRNELAWLDALLMIKKTMDANDRKA